MTDNASDAKPAAKRPTRRKTTKKAPAKRAPAKSAKSDEPNPAPTKVIAKPKPGAKATRESETTKVPRRRGKRGGVKNKKKATDIATESAVVDSPTIEDASDNPKPKTEQKTNKRRRRIIPDLKARARQREADREAERESERPQEQDTPVVAEAPARDRAPDDTPEAQTAPRPRRGRGRGGRKSAPRDDAAQNPSSSPASELAPEQTSAPKPTDPLAEHWDEIFGSATFADLGLRSTIQRAVAAQGFISPTKVQAAMIPLALKGTDILGQSRTGTGKTAAFGLPVANAAVRGVAYQCLILAPTRELAIQISAELRIFAQFTPLSVATVYGGQSIEQQVRHLEKSPEIIVATPGRLMDMLDRGHLHLHNMRFVVLDEVDRMLDIGFRDDIRSILSRIHNEHQTIFVSATISPEIEKLARTFMHSDAERIETAAGSLTASLVTQRYISVQPWDKSKMLAYWVREEKPELALIFCRMKRTVDKLAGRLFDRGINVAAIHGDLPQSKRNRIIDDLRAGKLHILIASDLAARGLDVDGITHVVNFDLPEDPEIYIHRIGRTARAGRGGMAFSFVTPDQGPLLTEIEKLANIHIDEQAYPDFVPNPVPEDIRGQRQADEKRIQEKRKTTRASAPELPAVAAVDASKFPGGIVPTKMPPRRLGGRVKRGR